MIFIFNAETIIKLLTIPLPVRNIVSLPVL